MYAQPEKILIIGGVAGGASAAARARRLSESANIRIIERGPDVSFANCGLPYHIGGEISQREDLALHTPTSLANFLNLTVETRSEAIAINRDLRQVTVRRLDSQTEETLPYDRLILAPGASPLRPPIPGLDSPKILTLRDLRDMDRIQNALSSANKILIVGAGFIGLELAEQLAHLQKDITVVERSPQVLPPLDAELASKLESELTSHGIQCHLNAEIQSFTDAPNGIQAHTQHGLLWHGDLVLLNIGVKPESQLAAQAGLALGPRGHIHVNAHQQTSDPLIYAVGDVVETTDSILGGSRSLPLGGPANRQGRTAADHIFLGDQALPYPGSLGTAIVRVFDLTAAVTGHGEGFLKSQKIPYNCVTINADHHASYYPGSETITLKILWDPTTGRLLGAQAIGKQGIDKRIDILATALRARMNIDDLCHLELTYAPPFGSAKDPVNLAGFAACNLRDGRLKPAYSLPATDSQLIDVRPAAKATSHPVPGAKSIPLAQLRTRLNELDRSRPIFTLCQMGKTSYFAARILQNHGFDAYSIIGGVHLRD